MKDAEYYGIEVGSLFCMSATAPCLGSLFEEWGISAECVVQYGLSGFNREMKIEQESRSMCHLKKLNSPSHQFHYFCFWKEEILGEDSLHKEGLQIWIHSISFENERQ
eukprot:8475367-Ditylum_brightwellii.AAC.1